MSIKLRTAILSCTRAEAWFIADFAPPHFISCQFSADFASQLDFRTSIPLLRRSDALHLAIARTRAPLTLDRPERSHQDVGLEDAAV